MRPVRNLLKLIGQLTACAVVLQGAVIHAQEAKPETKSSDAKQTDPSGTWMWSVPARNGGPERTNTLTLKAEGDKLTGKLTTPGRDGQLRESTVDAGKVSGAEVSFSITRQFNGNSMTAKYSGKVEGDSIKGKMEFERDGETQSRDWVATRQTSSADKADKTESK